MVISHYDVVPVPKDQATQWTTLPNKLTFKGGLFYGRGSNDDIGSGVIPSLQALRELKRDGVAMVNVRLIAGCDEETGGAGGLEAMLRKHQLQIDRGESGLLEADLVYLPDASPKVIAGSSGILFSDCVVDEEVKMDAFLKFIGGMKVFNEERSKVLSKFDSGDWPDKGAPSPKITSRFTHTKLDWTGSDGSISLGVHAETESHNYIPGTVTVELKGDVRRLSDGIDKMAKEQPIKVTKSEKENLILQVIGKGGHGGSPHKAKNASDLALPVLEKISKLCPGMKGKGSAGFDMRLVPEENMPKAFSELERWFEKERSANLPGAKLVSPEHRRKQGYATPVDDPDLQFLAKAVEALTGEKPKIVGEYGGTDASSFENVLRPDGRPVRALMYGSINAEARAHDYDENADPFLMRRVTDIIVWMARNWEKRKE
jgi:acetylornithine deacetylase/succinyl-diaminopimelate desuccinylase-like protein